MSNTYDGTGSAPIGFEDLNDALVSGGGHARSLRPISARNARPPAVRRYI
jgi:hypothetical protein